MSPTPLAGWLLGAAALSALVVPPIVSVVAAGVVLVATAVDAWTVRKQPEVQRRVNHIVSRGVPTELTITTTRRPFPTTIRQPAIPDVTIEPPQAVGRLHTTLTATRRGRHTLPPVVTRTVGMLRLGRADHQPSEPAELVVYPDMVAAHRLATQVRQGRFVAEGRRKRGPLGLGTEFESIRDYLPDDDIRQVNWRATQRMGRPMSNQWRVEQDRDVIVVIDTGRLMGGPADDDGTRTRLDAAVDAAAAVALVADVLGDRAGVIAFDSEVRRSVVPGRAGGDRVIRAIFDLEPSEDDSDYQRAFAHVGSAKRAFVLVLTDIIDEAAAQPLLEATALLARRHAVTVAGTEDLSLTEAIATAPAHTRDVWRSVVAIDVLDARTRVTERLRHLGAGVVEAPHASLSARCVGAYLAAKSTARF